MCGPALPYSVPLQVQHATWVLAHSPRRSPRTRPELSITAAGPATAAAPGNDALHNVIAAVEAEDCPVCLDPMQPSTSVMLPCRHLMCMACCKSLRALLQDTPGLDCPLCRTRHRVDSMSVFLAAHQASHFLQGSPVTPRMPARVVDADDSSIMSLTVGELKVVARALGVSVEGLVEREAIERTIAQAVERNQPIGQHTSTATGALPLAGLPQKALRAVLDHRLIPHADLVVAEDLAVRAAQSTRGSCLRLPPRVLKQMLRDFGRREDIENALEKEELARRCMAARALCRAAGNGAAALERERERDEERMFREQEASDCVGAKRRAREEAHALASCRRGSSTGGQCDDDAGAGGANCRAPGWSKWMLLPCPVADESGSSRRGIGSVHRILPRP